MQDNMEQYRTGGWRARYILIVSSLLYMVNYMDRQVLSVIIEPMQRELGFSDTQAGILQTVFLLSIALFSFPAAFFVDRWSRRKTMCIMAIIWSAATYITGLGRSFVGILVPRFLVGTGEAGFSAAGTAMITAAYPQKSRGMALGIFNVAIPLGAALGVMLGGYLSANHGGWRTPFFTFAAPGFLLGIAALFMKDYKTVDFEGTESKGVFFQHCRELLAIPSLKWLFIGYGMHNILAFSVLVWVPALLMRKLNIAEDKAGMMMGVISLTAIIGAMLGGVLADRWQKKNPRARMILPAISEIICALTAVIAIMLIDISFTSSVVLSIVYGIASVAGQPALGAVTQDVVHPRLKGMSWGMTVFSMYFFGGAWAPGATGLISDLLGGGGSGLASALILASAGGLLAAVCFFLGSRQYPEDVKKVDGFVLVSE